MTRRPSRLVAAQAVVVVLLVAVVFATLLRPEHNSPPSGVQAPGTPNPAGLPTPGVYAGGHHHDRHGGDGGRQIEPGTVESAGGDVTPAPATASAPAAAPSGAGEGAGTPTDDQYADTLTRLNARLN